MKPFLNFTALMLICVLLGAALQAEEDRVAPQKPRYAHGVYLTITCHRVAGAGRYPISYSQHEVTAIDGEKLKTPFRAHVEYLDKFDIPGNSEIVLSGYFTMKEIGAPECPKDSPESRYMMPSQFPFHFVDFFIATGVRSPDEAKKRFEQEVISKRTERSVESGKSED